MLKSYFVNIQVRSAVIVLLLLSPLVSATETPRLAYLVSDVRIPFWSIMAGGAKQRAAELGFTLDVYSADNNARQELLNTVQALESDIAGLVVSPTNSSAAVTILELAAEAGVPVVIADIGTKAGKYVSYIQSDNEQGAYELGLLLVKALEARGWSQGGVGIVSIPQSRKNGQARTRGFVNALKTSSFRMAGIRQQVDFSYEETYRFSRELIKDNSDLRAIWLQGSNRYQAALDAIHDEGREGDVLLICFDAEPEFIEMIRQKELVAAGMQQPRLIGEKAVSSLDAHIKGDPVPSRQMLPVLAVSPDNVDELLPLIHKNVLGLSIEQFND
ncbi:substrate-binding domain-containing protein [Marinobacterium iners]|uniref:substrate-binding domain-containing protein n=1 Tax=Marinobacterium iners TaxID=48076 RepID=UPI001A8F9F56|nr:substrate-binding domain-containing protein [Marinobacterium iners]